MPCPLLSSLLSFSPSRPWTESSFNSSVWRSPMILQCSICPVGSSKLELLWAPSQYLGYNDYLYQIIQKKTLSQPPPPPSKKKILSQPMSSLHVITMVNGSLEVDSASGLFHLHLHRWHWGLCGLDGRFIIWIFSRAGREVGQLHPQLKYAWGKLQPQNVHIFLLGLVSLVDLLVGSFGWQF